MQKEKKIESIYQYAKWFRNYTQCIYTSTIYLFFQPMPNPQASSRRNVNLECLPNGKIVSPVNGICMNSAEHSSNRRPHLARFSQMPPNKAKHTQGRTKNDSKIKIKIDTK